MEENTKKMKISLDFCKNQCQNLSFSDGDMIWMFEKMSQCLIVKANMELIQNGQTLSLLTIKSNHLLGMYK